VVILALILTGGRCGFSRGDTEKTRGQRTEQSLNTRGGVLSHVRQAKFGFSYSECHAGLKGQRPSLISAQPNGLGFLFDKNQGLKARLINPKIVLQPQMNAARLRRNRREMDIVTEVTARLRRNRKEKGFCHRGHGARYARHRRHRGSLDATRSHAGEPFFKGKGFFRMKTFKEPDGASPVSVPRAARSVFSVQRDWRNHKLPCFIEESFTKKTALMD